MVEGTEILDPDLAQPGVVGCRAREIAPRVPVSCRGGSSGSKGTWQVRWIA